MAAELNAHGNAMGGLSKTVKEHKLKPNKQQQRDLKTVKRVVKTSVKDTFAKKTQTAPESEPAEKERERPHRFDNTRVRGKAEGEVVDDTPINRGNAIGDSGVKRVYSERVSPTRTALPGNRLSIEPPKYVADPKGPSAIGAPGPTASESAAARAQSAAKGTRNTSTIKVAEPQVDLEDGPNFGKPVYSITDVPRQWNRNA